MTEAGAHSVAGSTVSTPTQQLGSGQPSPRMEAGNLSNVRGVGSGVLEYRIHTGPGYRVYFGRDEDTVIVLLGGGTKARQQKDIADAREVWQEYKRRKQQEV